jgi:hypothetical protein
MLIEKVNQTRRRLLKITGYSLLAGAHGLAFGIAAKKTALTAISRDPHTPLATSMRAIGEAYLHRYPAERSRSALLGAIQSRSGMVEFTTGEPALTALRRQVTEDFRTDELVYLNSWALSRTEARLAALTVV